MTVRHTADKRSERKLSTTKGAIASRKRYAKKASQKQCVSCGNQIIGGSRKAYCYVCSENQVAYTQVSGARHMMHLAGIKPGATKMTTKQMLFMLNLHSGAKPFKPKGEHR